MRTKTVMAWSGGKDSAAALWRLLQDPRWEVVGLLTTLTRGYDRISMQGVRRELLLAQAEALALPVHEVWIPPRCPNERYEAAMAEAIQRLKDQGVEAIAFGDLFLEDIRAYRERMLAPTGLRPLFPIWGADTGRLARRLLREGFRAFVCCVDPRRLAPEFAGRPYDDAFLDDLPDGVDPCGENGEFHTFVHRAPIFRRPIPVAVGQRVERDGFWYADILPA